MALDPNYRGAFDPAGETRPEVTYPDSRNIQGGFELSTPANVELVQDLDGARDGTHTYRGDWAYQLTVDEGNFGSIRATFGFVIDITAEMETNGVLLSARLYVPAASPWVGESIFAGGTIPGTGAGAGQSQSPLAEGWNDIRAYVLGANVTSSESGGQFTATIASISYPQVLDLDGTSVWIDEVMISVPPAPINALDPQQPPWEPAENDPFYTPGQYWVSTGTDTFQGLDLTPGDRLTCVSPGYELYTDATWEVTPAVGNLAEAVVAAPVSSDGTPVGYADWRIAVQMLTPTNVAARFDLAQFDVTTFTFYKWTDFTPYLRGMEWNRGSSEFGGRPESGTAQIELDNKGDLFSPSNYTTSFEDLSASIGGQLYSSTFGPGSIIRIVAFSPTWQGTENERWVPQFTGIVTAWPEETVGVGQDRYVTIEAVETIAQFARIDDNALSSVVGNNDTPIERIQRLAEAADWQFGYLDEFDYVNPNTGEVPGSSSTYQLQSTDMANNRLAEMFLTADSVGAVVRADRSGRLYLYNSPPIDMPIRGPIGTTTGGARFDSAQFDIDEFVGEGFNGLSPMPSGEVGGVYTIPWVFDSLVSENDDVAIINYAAYARVGSTEQVASDSASIRRYGRISTSRNDLINKSDELCQYLADKVVDERSRLTYRVGTVQLHSHHPNVTPAIISLDVHSAIRVEVSREPKLVAENATVDYLEHRVQPLNNGAVVWTLDIAFGRQTALYTR